MGVLENKNLKYIMNIIDLIYEDQQLSYIRTFYFNDEHVNQNATIRAK